MTDVLLLLYIRNHACWSSQTTKVPYRIIFNNKLTCHILLPWSTHKWVFFANFQNFSRLVQSHQRNVFLRRFSSFISLLYYFTHSHNWGFMCLINYFYFFFPFRPFISGWKWIVKVV